MQRNKEMFWPAKLLVIRFLVAYCNSSNHPPWSVCQSVRMSVTLFWTQPFFYNLKCFLSEYPVISDISGYPVMKYFQSWNIFHSKIAPSSLEIFLVSDCIKMVYNNHFYTIWNIWTIKVLSPQWFKKNWKISMRYHIIYNII